MLIITLHLGAVNQAEKCCIFCTSWEPHKLFCSPHHTLKGASSPH